MTPAPPSTPASGDAIWTPAPPALLPVGSLIDWPGPAKRIPPLFQEAYGQSLLRLTFNALFWVLNYQVGSATVTAASPGVFTLNSHGLVIGDPVFLESISTVTGLTADTTYFVMTVPTANTFTLGTTRSFAVSTGLVTVSTAVNTGGSAGQCIVFYSPYGVADSTHFAVPDLRGRATIALDNMGGSDAGRIGWDNVLGAGAGEGTHLLASTESGLPSHTHTFQVDNLGGAPAGQAGVAGSSRAANFGGLAIGVETNGGATAAAAHNTIQPTLAVRKLIYAGVDA